MSEPSPVEAAPGYPNIVRVVAPNPGPMTLGGTNTYLVSEGSEVWVVDPGPAIDPHLEAIRKEAARLGEIAGVVLTHSHADHSESAEAFGVSVVIGEVGEGDEAAAFVETDASDRRSGHPSDQSPVGSRTVGPMEVIPTPGHAADHVALVIDSACLCGDLVLGEGSSIVPPRSHGGSLTDYLASLEKLAALDLDLLAPGHGPWITDPQAKIDEYIAHRLEREAKLVAALEAGEHDRERLLDTAWDDVPKFLRPAAAIALQAHLEKLADEHRLPDDFEGSDPSGGGDSRGQTPGV